MTKHAFTKGVPGEQRASSPFTTKGLRCSAHLGVKEVKSKTKQEKLVFSFHGSVFPCLSSRGRGSLGSTTLFFFFIEATAATQGSLERCNPGRFLPPERNKNAGTKGNKKSSSLFVFLFSSKVTSSSGNELVFGSCLSFLLLLLLLLVPYLTLTSVLRENTNSEKGASCVYVWALQWFQFCSAASPTPFSFSFLMSNGIRKDVPLKRCVPPLAIAPEAARSLFVCVCVCVCVVVIPLSGRSSFGVVVGFFTIRLLAPCLFQLLPLCFLLYPRGSFSQQH